MTVLDKIVADKKETLGKIKKALPLSDVIRQAGEIQMVRPFRDAVNIKGELSIIAEMKKRSPSAGEILKAYDPAGMALKYEQAGARAISVLTEEKHFDGSPKHLVQACKAVGIPVLRKDFILDPYQVYETKALGASCVLLIVAILDLKLLAELVDLARELELDALVEVHDEPELEKALNAGADMIGINNRNLKDLKINIETTFRVRKFIPEGICVVSESGITNVETIRRLRRSWVQAALIGESILKSKNAGEQLMQFVEAGTSSQEAELN